MKKLLEEYVKIILVSVLGIMSLLLLLKSGGIMDFVDGLKPKSPEVSNQKAIEGLEKLEKRKGPIFQFQNRELLLGEEKKLSELIKEVRDAEGRSLKERVLYYLPDGREVYGSTKVDVTKIGNATYLFKVEDDQNLGSKKSLTILVKPPQSIPGAESLKVSFFIGASESDQVHAKLYEESGGGMVLSLEGEGRVSVYPKGKLPWKEYTAKITACYLASNIRAGDISHWFSGFINLTAHPDLSNLEAEKMVGTFENCTRLKNADIPNGVTNINSAYAGCNSLVNAPVVPATVQNMEFVFSGCAKLRGTLLIQASPVSYRESLKNAATRTGGIWLEVYSGIGNKEKVFEIVREENNKGNEAIVYRGTKEG